jgi:hypothetical protein
MVETDDLTMRGGDVKIQDATDQVPVTLTVVLSGRVRGGNVVARYPRRNLRQWLRRDPPPYRSLPS